MKKLYGINLDIEVKEGIDAAAVARNFSSSHLINGLLGRWLEQQEEKKNNPQETKE